VIDGSDCWTIKSFPNVYDRSGAISYIKNPPPTVFKTPAAVVANIPAKLPVAVPTKLPAKVFVKPPDKAAAKVQSVVAKIASSAKKIGKSIGNLFKKKKK
jgi:hypothetical protein